MRSALSQYYFEGNYRPLREEVTVTELAVTGTIPGHLDGRYVRNGPNPVLDPDQATYDFFLGAGMVHGVRIRDGRAEWYRNRWVRSAEVAKALGERPRPGPVHAGFDFAANTHVITQAGRTFAISEGGSCPYELSEDLATLGPCDFDGTLPGGYTAHPKRDPETGELHAISYFFGWGNRVQYSVLGTDGRIRRTVDIEVAGSPMMHDFSLTESHLVIYDLPVTFDLDAASRAAPRLLARPTRSVLSALIGRRKIPDRAVALMMRFGANAGVLPYSWNPEYPARVGVMPRDGDGSDVRWCDVEPCFVFHPLNAYDDGEHIVADVVRHPRLFATDNHGRFEGVPTLERWTIDMAAGKVLEERLDERGQEFPRVDERLVGRRHRYGYAVGWATNANGDVDFEANGVLKHDLTSGRTEVRSLGAGCGASEFAFVPNSSEAGEDDGVLMGFVYDPGTDRSDLVLLDAETLGTVAEVHLPCRVPYGFHGSWIAA